MKRIRNLPESGIPMQLLRKTEKKELEWIPLRKVIKYLREENIPLSKIPDVYNYLVFQQRRRYLPNMEGHTYICSYENNIAILSQGKYSYQMQLAVKNRSNHLKRWKIVNSTQIMLIRLRNAVELGGISDTQSDIENFLYSIRGIRV